MPRTNFEFHSGKILPFHGDAEKEKEWLLIVKEYDETNNPKSPGNLR